jgi:hypothetical protein
MLGEIQFDGERSKQEGDFRILIPPSRWDVVKEYCLCHLTNPDDTELESTPDRELAEEFEETVHFELKPDQYKVQPTGFVIEDHPVHTANRYAYGQFTVRIYRVFEVRITDAQLCRILLDMSRQISDDELARRARQSDNNRTNTVLTLPLRAVKESYLALPPEARYRRIVVEGFELDESVLVTLEDVNVPQYERI